ncbi:hypothetical protein GCM10009601_62700 [Streptomyces thermospinosisporus]|uniref:Uncharacterized protein n=1 Tax=Streptomyces thermospinosisporus TaxID=161482 RepID=A0ABN1Z8H5_9ACTN
MHQLRELAERLEKEHGSVTEEEEQAALDRIAAIDNWHDERRPPGSPSSACFGTALRRASDGPSPGRAETATD